MSEGGGEISPAEGPEAAQPITAPLAPEPAPGTSPTSSFRKPSAPPRPPEPAAPAGEIVETEAPSFALTPMHGLLAVGAVLIVVILWYGLAGRPAGEKSAPPSAPPPVSSPAPTQPPQAVAPAGSRLTAADRQAARDVLDGLRAVQSMAGGDASYQDYTSRVLNTKTQVEKYLQAYGGDPAIKDRVYEAMSLYLLALAAWNAKMANRQPTYESVGASPALALCPDIQPLLDLPPPTAVERTPAMTRGVNVAGNLDRLWFCAAGKIADAEQVLAQTR